MNPDSIAKFVSNGNITWTMTTIGYVKYTLNLVTWLRKIGVPWLLCVICFDPESEAFFRREQIHCIQWKEGVRRTQDGMAAFGTPSFELCNRQKLSVLKWFALNYARLGIRNSLYLDGDIVIQRDPWPLFKTVLDKGCSENIFFQCDCSNDEEHTGEEFSDGCASPCSGVILTRHVDTSQANIYEINTDVWKAAGAMDQYYIMKTLALTNTPYKILGRRQFGNGVWQKSGRWKDGNWTLLHYNYMVSSTKRTEMKKAEHWIINY